MGPLKLCPIGPMQTISAATLAGVTKLTVPAGAQVAILSVAGASAAVAFTDDGTTAPSSTVGVQIATGNPPYEYWGNLLNLRLILAAGTPTLNVLFYTISG